MSRRLLVALALVLPAAACASDYDLSTHIEPDEAMSQVQLAADGDSDGDATTDAIDWADPAEATGQQLQDLVWLVAGDVSDDALAMARAADADAALDPDGDGQASTIARCPSLEVVADTAFYTGEGCLSQSGRIYTGAIETSGVWGMDFDTYEQALDVRDLTAVAELSFHAWAERQPESELTLGGQLALAEEHSTSVDGDHSRSYELMWLSLGGSGRGFEAAILAERSCSSTASDSGTESWCRVESGAVHYDGVGTLRISADWGEDAEGRYGSVLLVGTRTVRIDLHPATSDCPTYTVDSYPAGTLCK